MWLQHLLCLKLFVLKANVISWLHSPSTVKWNFFFSFFRLSTYHTIHTFRSRKTTDVKTPSDANRIKSCTKVKGQTLRVDYNKNILNIIQPLVIWQTLLNFKWSLKAFIQCYTVQLLHLHEQRGKNRSLNNLSPCPIHCWITSVGSGAEHCIQYHQGIS